MLFKQSAANQSAAHCMQIPRAQVVLDDSEDADMIEEPQSQGTNVQHCAHGIHSAGGPPTRVLPALNGPGASVSWRDKVRSALRV